LSKCLPLCSHARPCAGHPRLRDVRPIFNCQTAWASIIARIFSGAGYAVVFFVPRKTRGRWRARWRNHCSFCAALPLERRGRLMARHRGVFLTAPGRALQGPSVAPALASRFGRSTRRAVGPREPGSWRTAHSGRRAELPAPPGCGRNVLSRPRAPHPIPPA
jgi:hypothetical protein